MTSMRYWLEFTWFYTLCILSIPMAPFVFLWVVYMRASEDYQNKHHKTKVPKGE